MGLVAVSRPWLRSFAINAATGWVPNGNTDAPAHGGHAIAGVRSDMLTEASMERLLGKLGQELEEEAE